MHKWPFFALVAVRLASVSAQTVLDEDLLENGDDATVARRIECLEEWKSHPLNLNGADADEIGLIPIGSPRIARAIVKERRENGPFTGPADLQRRLGLDSLTLEALLEYSVIGPPSGFAPAKFRVRTGCRREFPEAQGYRTGKYAGSPWQSCQRADFNWRDVVAGGLFVEKDPGEKRLNDETSGFLKIQNASQTARVTLGRFTAGGGLGLVLWNPSAWFRGSDPSAPVRGNPSLIRGIASGGGNAALLGAALESRLGIFRTAVCASRMRVDAAVDGEGRITSIRTDGLHRTESEIRSARSANESALAVRIQACRAGIRFGASGLWTRYSRDVDAADPERRPGGFRGRANAVTGLDWFFARGPWSVTGEFARSLSGGTALMQGFALDLGNLEFMSSVRGYGANFQNPRAAGFGGGDTWNEQGWYLGMSCRLPDGTRMNGYADVFRSPGKTWFVPVPSEGAEWMIWAERQWSASVTVRVRARLRDAMRMEAPLDQAGSRAEVLTGRSFRSLRAELELKPGGGLLLRTRVESVRADRTDAARLKPAADSGFLFFEDLRFRKSDRFGLDLRWTVFDADSWDSGIPVIENDLPGSAGVSTLYKKGHRWTMVLRWRMARGLTASVNFGTTFHAFADSWGSGNDRIPGNTERKAGVLLEWKRL
jgi:hypothetical protein